MKYRMNMRIGRTVFVILVALSVATLPTASGFAAGATTIMTDVSASNAIPDCDHHHNAPSDKTQKTTDDSACMANCALACFGFTATGLSSFIISSPISAALKPVRTNTHVSSRMGSPPFRPPRS